MSNIFLITRPKHDEATNYLYHWAEPIIKEAKKKHFQVLDLSGEKANSDDLSGRIKKLNPDSLFFNGHGSLDTIKGHNDKILVSVDNNESLLTDKITYALSCSSAKKLGQSSVKKGAKSFIGYKEDFIFIHETNKMTRPIEDKTAKLFLEPSNLVVSAIIKGNTSKEAYERSQKEFNHNLRKLMTSESPQEDRSSIPWLCWDMKHQVCLGDGSAKI